MFLGIHTIPFVLPMISLSPSKANVHRNTILWQTQDRAGDTQEDDVLRYPQHSPQHSLEGWKIQLFKHLALQAAHWHGTTGVVPVKLCADTRACVFSRQTLYVYVTGKRTSPTGTTGTQHLCRSHMENHRCTQTERVCTPILTAGRRQCSTHATKTTLTYHQQAHLYTHIQTFVHPSPTQYTHLFVVHTHTHIYIHTYIQHTYKGMYAYTTVRRRYTCDHRGRIVVHPSDTMLSSGLERRHKSNACSHQGYMRA